MESLRDKFGEDDYKFLRNTLLWIKAHPQSNVKFNKQLKPIRREIFDNLKLNISEGNGKCIDFDVFKSYFWAYFERNKNIHIFDIFKNIEVKLNDGNNINLSNYLKILNLIRLNINLAVVDIQNSKKTFFVVDNQPVYSMGELSLNIDDQVTKYNNFLYNRLSQYNMSFKKGLFDFKNIIYCYVLRNKFKGVDFFDFSRSKSIIYVAGIPINLDVLFQILEMLNIKDNVDITKKI